MRRKFPRSDERDAVRCDMTPMIDVTFQLLIFFLLTLQFPTLEGHLRAHLPRGEGVNPSPTDPPPERIRVRIDEQRDGELRTLRYSVGPRECATLGALRAAVAELHRASPASPAVIDARDGVRNGEVVAVLDLLLLEGCAEIAFAGAR